jgi:hypothetical protein
MLKTCMNTVAATDYLVLGRGVYPEPVDIDVLWKKAEPKIGT